LLQNRSTPIILSGLPQYPQKLVRSIGLAVSAFVFLVRNLFNVHIIEPGWQASMQNDFAVQL